MDNLDLVDDVARSLAVIKVAIALGARIEAPSGSIFYELIMRNSNNKNAYHNVGIYSSRQEAEFAAARWYVENEASTDPSDHNKLPWVLRNLTDEEWIKNASYDDVKRHKRL